MLLLEVNLQPEVVCGGVAAVLALVVLLVMDFLMDSPVGNSTGTLNVESKPLQWRCLPLQKEN